MFGHRLVARARGLRHSHVAALAVLAVGLALILGPGLPGAAPSGSTSPSPNPTGIAWTPGPSAAAWAHLTLAPEQRLADLSATATIGRLVATSTRFTLTSLGAASAADLASRIQTDPKIQVSVSPGPTRNSVELAPTERLSDATRYRFRLMAPDGSLAGTWTFRTDAPLHIVGRLPDGQTTGVPTDTGIEVTFDQDSPTGFPDHFSISPTVAGRFERHDRTWVFVPSKPLKESTIYTVTVRKGVGVTGSDRILETTELWQFETATKATDLADVSFNRAVVEARPGDDLRLFVDIVIQEGQSRPKSLPYQLYRVPTLSAAAGLASRLVSRPIWAQGSGDSLVDTSGLTRVAAGIAPVGTIGADVWPHDYVSIAVRPDPGWYIVALPVNGQPPAQALLQVTNVAGYVQTTETRTVAWVNDLETLSPIGDASVALPSGQVLGTTDARGLLVASTPAALVPKSVEGWWAEATATVLTISTPDGRGLVAPVGMPEGTSFAPLWQAPSEADQASFHWWLVLTTDRTMYRSTDTIHAWGIIRSRDDLAVPKGLELRLVAAGSPAPIARIAVAASSSGAFSGDLPINALPTGNDELQLWSHGELLSSTWLQVAEIRKPAYQIELSTDHTAYIDGDPIRLSGRVVFYDGTVAPGISLRAEMGDRSSTLTAGTDGAFSAAYHAWMAEHAGWTWDGINVAPTDPEEGQISASTQVTVFPSSLWLDGSASLSGSTLSVTGTLSKVDLAKVEAQLAVGNVGIDPAGAGVPGRPVAVRVVHLIPVRTQTGTEYDFIAKRLSPVYRYDTREETVATRTLQSTESGRISASFAVPTATDSYRVELRATDTKGRVVELEENVEGSPQAAEPWSQPYFGAEVGGCGGWPTTTASVGQTVSLTVHERDGSIGSDGAYLFLTGERGLRDVVAQASPTLRLTFGTADLPSLQARAVRLTSTGYQVLNPAQVVVDQASKRLSVRLTPDRSRYAPGDTINLDVTTIGPSGAPVAADVIVRAIDEKLYSIGGAVDVDVLGELMQDQSDGYLQAFASHPLPYVRNDGCGGTGGGRSDFRDAATFQHVRTGTNGRTTVSFKAPDDLTSWHVGASAVSTALDAGSGAVVVPVSLPFFADAVMASTYLVGDRPTILVRAYGESLAAGDSVRFVVEVPDAGLTRTLDAKAFTAAAVVLPALPAGDHRVTIAATSRSGTLSDALERTVHVIPTRLTQLQYRQDPLTASFTAPGGTGLTTMIVSDAGRGSLLPILNSLVASSGARYDQAAPAEMARRILVAAFGVDPATVPDATFDLGRYAQLDFESGRIAILPYSSPDLELTALAALTVPDLIGPHANVVAALEEWRSEEETTSERRVMAVAGLAALDQDVADDLAAMDRPERTLKERLWLGLAYAASGDETAARGIERAILSASGEQLGGWVRVNAGPGTDREATLDASALMMLLAADLGDPLAADLQAYVRDQPSTEHVHALETIGYVRAGLDRLPRAEASFAWTLAGVRHEEVLMPGQSFSMALTEAQRQTFHVEPISGNAAVTSTWLGETAIADLPATNAVTIARGITPATEVARNGIVRVELTVSLGDVAPLGEYQAVDLVPSGLAPLVAEPAWPEDDQSDPATRSSVPYLTPTAIDGQRVTWLLTLDSSRSSFKLVYRARVVTPGTYAWEPAVIQAVLAPSIGGHTPASTYTIR